MTNVYAAMARKRTAIEKIKQVALYYQVFGPRGLWIFARTRHLEVPAEMELRVPDFGHRLVLRLKSSDLPTYSKIFRSQDYHFYTSKEPRFIIDAGANVGYAALYFAKQFPEARILAIEPEEGNFKLLQKNTATFRNIVPVHGALWNKNGTINLVDPGIGPWGFQTHENASEHAFVTSVPAFTIDRLMKDHGFERVDILKVDIEGGEKEVFENSEEWIDKVGVIMAELHDAMKPGCSVSFGKATAKFDLGARKGENVFAWRRECGSLVKQPK
jgi:FkbM family methyltransferase